MNLPVYVTGHQHPDTDSIAGAIAYAYYQNAIGNSAVACRLGAINSETKYLLNRFGFEAPMMLKDARNTLKEIDLDEPLTIDEDATILDAINKMRETGTPSMVVSDKDGHIKGMISRSDMAMMFMSDTESQIDLISQTPIENIVHTIKGHIVYKSEKPHLNGKISIIAALSGERLANYNVTDRIVIMGSDEDKMISMIEKGAGMIIAVWTESISDEIIECAQKHNCSIVLSGYGSMNTSRFIYFAPSITLVMTKDVITFNANELAEVAGRKLMQSRFRQYPVVDDDNHLVGYVSRYHILNYKNKDIIMVDHNEFSQSVHGIEKAQVKEVIDHHRINDFMTKTPVNFRCETVGSASTIIASIFRENHVELPANLAGLLLGAMMSDMMNFNSPTTTQKDRVVADWLCEVAGISLEDFKNEMFKAQAADLSEPIQKLIDTDIKFFETPNRRIMISQVIVGNTQDVLDRNEEFEKEVQEFASSHTLDLLVVAFTSNVENGSILYYGGSDDEYAESVLTEEERKHAFCPGLLSRKLQLLPKILGTSN